MLIYLCGIIKGTGGENMANKEQSSNKNQKKVAKYTLKEKRAMKREKKANKA